jgi:hypothetical protein
MIPCPHCRLMPCRCREVALAVASSPDARRYREVSAMATGDKLDYAIMRTAAGMRADAPSIWVLERWSWLPFLATARETFEVFSSEWE